LVEGGDREPARRQELGRAGEEGWVIDRLADPVALPERRDEVLDRLEIDVPARDVDVRRRLLERRPDVRADEDRALLVLPAPGDRSRIAREGGIDADEDLGALGDLLLGAAGGPACRGDPDVLGVRPLVQVQAAEG
jgi:hypothetical protein